MRALIFICMALSLCVLPACKKGPGVGGKNVITGKVYVREFNSTGTAVIREYYGAEIDVYIVYGDHPVADDDVETHFDGTYRFEYLLPGDYTVYTYSKDVTGSGPSPKIEVVKTVRITGKEEVVELEDFVIDDN